MSASTTTSPQPWSTSMEKMVAWNNHGVELLGTGSYCLARQAFYTATDWMYAVCDEQEQLRGVQEQQIPARQQTEMCVLSLREAHSASSSPPSSHAGDNTQAQGSSANCNVSPPSSIPPPCQDDSSASFPPPESPLYSFLRPVLFSAEDFLSQARHTPIIQLSVCIIFNLAVANHSIALSSSEEMRRCLKDPRGTIPPELENQQVLCALHEAIYLYKLAYRLQTNGGMVVSWLHTMGMINNVGRLLAFTGELDESKNCFEQLLTLILVEQTNKTARQEPTTGKCPYVESFMDNIYQVVLRDNWTVSPAA